MAKYANVSNELGKIICESLGIDANLVDEIKIDLKVGDVARLSIWGFWDTKLDRPVIRELKEYKIVPIDD